MTTSTYKYTKELERPPDTNIPYRDYKVHHVGYTPRPTNYTPVPLTNQDFKMPGDFYFESLRLGFLASPLHHLIQKKKKNAARFRRQA